MKSTGKKAPTPLRVAAAATAGAAVLAGALLAKRCWVHATCKPFYAEASRLFKIPGIDEGFVPQDLFYLEEEGIWLFSGYMANRSPSPLYKVLPDGTTCRHEVQLPNGSLYRGHGAAVAAAGPYALLTVKDGFVALDRQRLVSAADGEVLQVLGHRHVPLQPAFMNVQKGRLYIGEFYHRLFYPTPKSHWLRCPSGEVNPALALAFSPDDQGPFGFAEQPTAVYSLPGNVQGLCLTPEGRMALSLSWGFGNAQVRLYDPARAPETSTYAIDGHEMPLRFLDDATLVRTLTVPPMAEGIDCHGGTIYLANESASNLYLLGKLYGGRYVYAFPADQAAEGR